MHFEQKKLLYNKTFFDFGEEELSYRIEGDTQTVAFKTPYGEINPQKSMERFAEKTIFYIGYALTLSSAAMLLCLLLYTGRSEHSYWSNAISYCILFIGLGIRLWGKYKAKYEATKISVSSGAKLIIIHDGQQKTICDEIYKRRLNNYRRNYGEVDTLNHPDAELKKFLWLKENSIITAQEFTDAREKILESSQTSSSMYS